MKITDMQKRPVERYFMVTWAVGTEFGGMTRMCLQRATIFRDHASINAPILTFDANPLYDENVGRLRGVGLLGDSTEVLNIYHYYRNLDQLNISAVMSPERAPTHLGSIGGINEAVDSSGRLFMRSYFGHRESEPYCREFYRRDGSIFLVDETPTDGQEVRRGRLISVLSSDGRVVDQFSSGPKWYRDWIIELSGGRPTVVIVDSGYASQFVAKIDSTNIVKAAVYHSNHVSGAGDPFRGKLAPGRRHIAERPHEWDAIVFLTEQQKRDFVDRFGKLTNLFAITNPRVRSVLAPTFGSRRTNYGVMFCRLSPVKNISAALAIIGRVRESIPDIRLDIFGDGPLRDSIQDQIVSAGLSDSVFLMGFVDDMPTRLKSASFSLLTSKYEGQPLSIMESLGAGCPPVSYRIRYGPEDLIHDDQDGFLVASGDEEGASERIRQICQDPGRAERMGAQAWENSSRFGEPAVLDSWLSLIGRIWSVRHQRTQITAPRIVVGRMEMGRRAHIRQVGYISWKSVVVPDGGDEPRATLQILPRGVGEPVFEPVSWRKLSESCYEFGIDVGSFELEEHLKEFQTQADVSLMVVWNNSSVTCRVPFGGGAKGPVPYRSRSGGLSFKVLDAAL